MADTSCGDRPASDRNVVHSSQTVSHSFLVEHLPEIDLMIHCGHLIRFSFERRKCPIAALDRHAVRTTTQNAHRHHDRVGGLLVPAISTSKAVLLPGRTWLYAHILLQFCIDVKPRAPVSRSTLVHSSRPYSG